MKTPPRTGFSPRIGALWADTENRWLAAIIAVGMLARLAAALYLGNQVEPTPGAYDQIYFHDVALNLLSGKGFSFTRPPWSFIQPDALTAFTSFLYQIFLAGVYAVLGPHPLAARIIQALICSLMPWPVYLVTRRIVGPSPRWGQWAGPIGLAAAAITAGYAYFIYYSATLMTEGLYLMAVVMALLLTLNLAEQPTLRRWLGWGLAMGLAILMRQVFMPIAALFLVYVLFRIGRRVRLFHVLAAGAVVAALILPWTVRNYLVFDRFLLLNSQAGQVFWNANHPDLGVEFEGAAMFPIPEDLRGVNEIDLSNELMRRGWANIAADPWRFVGLSLDRIPKFFKFWPAAESSLLSNLSRTLSFGLFLPFMLAGLVLSLREWRRWLLLYLFIVGYTGMHVISWVMIRYRMPVDAALIPFAALAMVILAEWLWQRRRMGAK